ncbi:EamA family transporter [Chloroflexota bacterium]
MDWASTAILSAALVGVVNIIDSYMLSKRMPGLQAFLLPVGIIHSGYGLFVFYLVPLAEGVSVWLILLAIAAGMLRTSAVLIMLYYFRRKEVSRVVPVVNIYPIFVAIIAIPLLGETLYYLQWLAIVIVVAGAVVISTEKESSGSINLLSKPFLFLFIASLLFAVADVASKYTLTYISFWNLFSITAVCMGGTFLLVSVRPRILGQWRDMERKSSAIALLTFNEILAPLAIMLSLWAMQRGQVSLVSTILGSRPIFVALYSLILGRLAPEFLRWSALSEGWVLRLVATGMIVGGIAIIYLT